MTAAAAPIHVLIVDDSVVMRRILARALERDPLGASTESATNGRLALLKIAHRRPDVVVLDVEMPELDGFATLAELRRTHPQLPVVLFSSVDERSAAVALEALSLGATDFVIKPTGGSVEDAETYVAEHLIPLIAALTVPLPSVRHVPPVPASASLGTVHVLVIGVSTGGPDALHRMVGALPSDLPVPVLIVQHMPALFTRLLAERLDRACAVPVAEAQDGEVLRPGRIYIAPGGRHLALVRSSAQVVVALDDGPAENSCRPAADVLFRTAAAVHGAGVLAVVLTGMGRDGLRGCEAVHTAGGQVVVQDPSTAVIASMPAAVVAAGLAQAILPLDELVPELLRRIRRGR